MAMDRNPTEGAEQPSGQLRTAPASDVQDSPAICARIILKRAGIKPLLVGIASAALSTTTLAQTTTGPRVTAVAQARAIIISDAVRVEQGAVRTRDMGVANNRVVAPPLNTIVTIRPCDGARPVAVGAPAQRCMMHITNLP